MNLQQVVNQLQAERDALCMELRQSRVKQEWVRLSTLVQQRGLRRGARHTRCPTAVVSPSVLDALEFDLTLEDPTGGDEGSQMPVPQARPSAFAPEGRGYHDVHGEDVLHFDGWCWWALNTTAFLPTELDQVRGTALDVSVAEPPAVAESDTESLGHNSDVAGGEVPDPSTQSETEVVIPVPPRNNRGFSAALRHLDEFSLVDVFQRRAHVMRCVLHIMRGVFASAVRAACEEIVAAHAVVDIPRLERAWKLLLLLPRMLLTKPRRGGFVPRKELEIRLALFSFGEWHILMR